MKKIISALTLGAMVAGAAFADVSVNLNFRQRATMYSQLNASDSKNDTKDMFFTDAYCGNGSDNLAISLSGDIVSFDMQWVTDEAKTNGWRAKGLNASVFLGPVTVFGGVWADGKQNGAYRNKVLIDAANLEGADFEWWKIGSGYKNSPCNWIDNVVGLVGVNLPEAYSAGVSYKVPGIDNGALTINAAYVSNELTSTSNKVIAYNDKAAVHSYNLVADGRIDGIGQAEFCFKYGDYQSAPTLDAMAIGLYVMPTTVRNLFTTVGGAVGFVDMTATDWSAQLRLHYVVKPNKFMITSFHTAQGIIDPEGITKDKLGVKNEVSRGIAQVEANTGAMDGKTGIQSRDMVITNNLGIRYFVTPNFAVTGIFNDQIGMGKNMGAKIANKDGKLATDARMDIRCSAWAQFYADANNSVSIGCVYTQQDVTGAYAEADQVSTFSVPVIFRVKM